MRVKQIIHRAQILILTLQKLKKHISDKFTLRDSDVWLRRLNKNIESCNQIVSNEKDLSIGLKRKLQTTIQHLKAIRKIILNYQHKHFGLGLQSSSRETNTNEMVVWESVASCFQGRVQTGVIINLLHKDLIQFLNDSRPIFQQKISQILKKFLLLKVNTTFCGEFIKAKNDVQGEVDVKYLSTGNAVVDLGTELNDWFVENVQDKILNQMSEFQERDSGWALNNIIYLEININKFEMGNGSSFVELPKEIANKRACINIRNDDQACFYWSVVCGLFPARFRQYLPSSYPYYKSVLKTENLQTPMEMNKISKFEKDNDISINVYILEFNKNEKTSFFSVLPARLTKEKREKHSNLLLIQNKYYPKVNDFDPDPQDNDYEEIKYHYCYIKNLSRLVSSQLSKYNHKKYICDRCLNYFNNETRLHDHETICSSFNEYKVSFPKYDYVEFRNHIYKQRTPFVIYADFESQLRKVNLKISDKTSKYQKHEAYSAAYYFKCSYDDSISFFKSYRGLDCIDWFVEEISNLSKFVRSKFKDIIPMDSEISLDQRSSHCHICEKPFLKEDVIVRDHDHFTGKFRGFAHQACNLNFKKIFVVPVVFQNLSGYDSHFLLPVLAKKSYVSIVPVNKEKYISFTYFEPDYNIKFRFIDSFRFLGASLDNLVSSMDKNELYILRKEFSDLDESKLNLLSQKGIFCYDYIDHIDKLNETTLPPIEEFYNKLSESNISEEKYSHAQSVWQSFEIKNLGEYSDLYLKTDVILLADIFENFRKTCMATHVLDPAWYFSMPGYTWDCMLRFTKCRLELLRDIDQIMFIERAIRGGISVCVGRYAEANNKYMPNYDSSRDDSYIMYFDVNNLYGKAMCEPLPYGGFDWMSHQEIDSFNVMNIPDESSQGYILEVDLEYPQKLHDTHRDFPFCAEHRVPPNSKLPKLMTTLYNKEKYVIHYRNLKQALKNGLVLKKIHKILKFNQSRWLKCYIDHNNKLRTQAKTKFGINLYKLFNNAAYGKTMENIRKHRIVKFVKAWDGRYGAKNLISSPRFHSRTILDNNLLLIELKKSELCFNKPLYIGMSILDLSKTTMYEFHYNYMLPNLGPEKCKIQYMDTDSFIYNIKCYDAYESVIKADLTKFDTSDYPNDNPYNIPQINKKVLGLMKDETNGTIISHYAGLRSKMYTFKILTGSVVKKSKGIQYNIVKNKISFDDYVECLTNFREKYATQRTIRSYTHNVFSIEQTKVALSPLDDKRYLLPNSYETLPWGHYKVP
ncbi:uncharacterized protein LOC132701296 [Cylas formicarius]|uniref:uncharacterized protein LOC132701296 n=1 Tax=Cylas formicarius TaxID=197179 RepID=UPI002958D20F|nr:uncharacterized protein LOC132701296 [Cylas formicarius]XP_060525077.1 uncharacterized protein LOC132701296 [Cylas formicarius]XP_060525078.1 uncharacterized protein LOC132701296 [Cylas formicarius]